MKKNEHISSFILCLLGILTLCYLEYTFPEVHLLRRGSKLLTKADMQPSKELYLPKMQENAAFDEPEWAMFAMYVDMESTVIDNAIVFNDPYQKPGLTAGEVARTKNLLAAYESGTVTYDGESILNKKENVDLGAYFLNEADWDGEQMYILLPCTCLTDKQIVAIIDAFHQCGLRFDPERLNYRNCSRGGSAAMTRPYTEDEMSRYNTIKESLENDNGTEKNLGSNGTIHSQKIDLVPAYYCGLNQFELVPYRCLTDEEITAKIILNAE